MSKTEFAAAFESLTGNPPFPWQWALYDQWFRNGSFPPSCNLPTGLGKTSVVAIWLIALAIHTDKLPRRLVYVVNRRTVVDQTTNEVEKLRDNLLKRSELAALNENLFALWDPQGVIRRERADGAKAKEELSSLALSTLRGQFADNREWSADPSRPAVICGTVDMIGSRLLFSGYGVGFKGKPLHAGFLGQDVLLVHDEAHLEPAFQELLMAIESEQMRSNEFGKFHVVELSATSRAEGEIFTLTPEEKQPETDNDDAPAPLKTVWKRITSKKGLKFHSAERSELARTIGRTALQHKLSGKAILVFVRTVEEVKTVRDVLTEKKGGAGVLENQVQVLTGTLRGLERDRLAKDDPIFQRLFLKAQSDGRTVYLVCTSAGEVGIDISADHLVCDLTPYDSIAQRLGRVNRRGDGAAEVDVIYESDPDPKKKDDGLEKARWLTKDILERLPPCNWIDNNRHEASPHELSKILGQLPEPERKAAFSPTPVILPATDILFDAWALTTVKGKLPGRPPVEEYLHGISEYDPPQTTVAWREEVELFSADILNDNRLEIEDILEVYPLKPHEELSGSTYGKNKVFEQLEDIAARDAQREPDKRLSAWVIDPDGTATIQSLQKLVEKDQKNKPVVNLAGRTVVLPPHAGGLSGGLLKGDEAHNQGTLYDVSGEWYVDAEKTIPRRKRIRNDEAKPGHVTAMRPCCTIDLKPDTEHAGGVSQTATAGLADAAEGTTKGRYWHWYVRPKSADDDGSKTAEEPITWQHHTNDVVANAKRIADALFEKGSELHTALVVAAEFHDLGKRRVLWQRSIGNPNPTDWYAKSGKGWRMREISDYRHEFGSLLDVMGKEEFTALKGKPEVQDQVLHLIAVHHGYGRPHFPTDQAFDPAPPKGVNPEEIAREVPRRFARLQRKYGRWGLAYLESLLRAADWAASANPSAFVEEKS